MNTRESVNERIRRFLIALAQHPEAEKRMKRYPRPAALSGFAEIALAVGQELGIQARVTKEELTKALEAEAAARLARIRKTEDMQPLGDDDLKSVSGGEGMPMEEWSAAAYLLRWLQEESSILKTEGTRAME